MKSETPEANFNKLNIREPSPRPIRSLNSKNIIIFITSICIIIGLVVVYSLKPKDVKEQLSKPKQIAAMPSQKVAELPDDYLAAELRKPKIEVKTEANKVDPLTELARESKIKKIKNAELARSSGLSFKQVSIEESRASFSAGGGNITAATSPSIVEDQNRQEAKNYFLNKDRNNKEVLLHGVRDKLSNYQISAGTIIPGVLLTGINSDLPGQILGQVSQNIYDSASGKYLLIPLGAKILGEYDSRVVYGQERVLIVWTRILFPDGSSINLEGMPGVDMSGYAGLSDKVNNHYMKLLGGVVFSSILSASAQMADGRNYNSVDPDFSELATQGAARNINDVGQEITQKNLNIQPTLEIRPGMRFNVFVNRDMVLRREDTES